MYKFGTIVLVPFPFTDLTAAKLRPALIVSKTDENAEDVMVCFITSQNTYGKSTSSYKMPIKTEHFKMTGLKTDSYFRFNKIATLDKKLILGEIGSLHKNHLKAMKKVFLSAFGF